MPPKVLNPRARRKVVRASVARIETKIPGWEEKEILTDKDRQAIIRSLKRLQELNEEFRTYHYSIIELMEDEAVLAEEQQTLDECENKVDDLTGRLEDLIKVAEPVLTRTPVIDDPMQAHGRTHHHSKSFHGLRPLT